MHHQSSIPTSITNHTSIANHPSIPCKPAIHRSGFIHPYITCHPFIHRRPSIFPSLGMNLNSTSNTPVHLRASICQPLDRSVYWGRWAWAGDMGNCCKLTVLRCPPRPRHTLHTDIQTYKQTRIAYQQTYIQSYMHARTDTTHGDKFNRVERSDWATFCPAYKPLKVGTIIFWSTGSGPVDQIIRYPFLLFLVDRPLNL